MNSTTGYLKHIHFRFCGLGTQCDMFNFDPTTMICSYFPHVALKPRNLMEVIQLSASPTSKIYFMECSQSMELNLIAQSDPTTSNLGDYEISHTCTSNYRLGVAVELTEPQFLKSSMAGYQSLPTAFCNGPFQFSRDKSLSIVDLENLGFTQDYISKIKPAAVTSHYTWVKPNALNNCKVNTSSDLKTCIIEGLTSTKFDLTLLVDGISLKSQSLSIPRTTRNNQCNQVLGTCGGNTFDFVAVIGIKEFPVGDVVLKATASTEEALGLGLVSGGTELLIDSPFMIGCFSLLNNLVGETTSSASTAKECIVACVDKLKRFAAISGGTCNCFEEFPSHSVLPDQVRLNKRHEGKILIVK